MKARLIKVSTNIINVYLSDVSQSIERGSIDLVLFLNKKSQEIISTQEYSSLKLDYSFNLSKHFPRNIIDFEYKIIVRNESLTEETRKSAIFGKLPHHLSGVVKKIRNDFSIVSRQHNGSIAYFFKKLPGEKRCDVCWDNDLKSSNNSNCPVCGGTGKIRYFSDPVKTICGPIKWQNESYSIDNPGKALSSPTVSMSALADVVLTTDDIVFYVSTSEFYRVISRTVSEIKGYATLQTLVSNLLPSNYTDTKICFDKLKDEGIL